MKRIGIAAVLVCAAFACAGRPALAAPWWKELPAESELLVRVEADSPDEADLEFRATVLHMLPQQKVSLYGYGCRIEASANWPPERDLARIPRAKGDA